jgi:hypothetical protein
MIFPAGRPVEQVLMGSIFTAVGLTTFLFPTTMSRISFQPDFLMGSASKRASEAAKKVSSTGHGEATTLSGASNLDLYPLDSSHYMQPPFQMAVQRFGAKTALAGLLILSARFTPETYRNLGLGVIPFIALDYLGFTTGGLSKIGALGDGLINATVALCCYVGFQNFLSL